MGRISVRSGDWVVVCDGRKALILENIGDARYPKLHTKEVSEHTEPRTSEQGTDRPGKTHSSVGTARSAMEQTDWHDQSERAFLTALADRLHVALTKGETQALIMVASPRALGMIRSWWPAWTEWLAEKSAAPVPRPPLGGTDGKFAPLEDAPGCYVMMK